MNQEVKTWKKSLFNMSSFGVLILFYLSCKLLPCHGKVYPPSNKTKFVFSNGSTARLQWNVVDATDIVSRIWSFKSSDGSPEERIATIIFNNPPEIQNSSLPRVSVKPPATLILHNVTEIYDGTYKFNLGATGGGISEVVVYIAVKPNVTINCSSHVFVNKSKDIICECKCENGNPPAECTWYKNGTQDGEIKTRVNTLILPDVNKEDSGNYTCVGKSHVEAQDEKSIKVTVYFQPTNTRIKFSPNIAVINRLVIITCTFDGQPKPNYIIYHNGTSNVSTNEPYEKTVTWEDAGTYECIAINKLGNDSDSKFLNVTDKPIPTTPPTRFQSTYTQATQPSSTVQRTVPSNSVTTAKPGESGPNVGLIIGIVVGVVALIAIICAGVYYKSKGRDNKSVEFAVDPNGSRVMTNHYELEEDHGEDAGAYDTVKQSDDGEGSQDKKKPAGDSLPPVYASVNKDNRQGNTLYASLDSEALRKPGSKKKQPETKNVPTEYASIDFMQTGKTPNADNA